MKRLILCALCALACSAAVAQQPQQKPDSLKWSVSFSTTAERDWVLSKLDTAALTIANSDIPAKDRVKTAAYLQTIYRFMASQFTQQNIPAKPAAPKQPADNKK